MSEWVDVAQVASGLAAVAAVWVAVSTARAARRSPLADAYLAGWGSVLDVLTAASVGRDEIPPEVEADQLMTRFNSADSQLSVIEATLRVRVYGRSIRFDLNSLLIDTLYDNPDIRAVPPHASLTADDVPRPAWAHCTDDEWQGVINSVPFNAMWISQLWDLPGGPWLGLDDQNRLMRWYAPIVLGGLRTPGLVTSPDAPTQQQLAFLLKAYTNAFVLPWIRDASREALMGRLGARGYRLLWRRRHTRWLRRAVRGHPQTDPVLTSFDPTGP